MLVSTTILLASRVPHTSNSRIPPKVPNPAYQTAVDSLIYHIAVGVQLSKASPNVYLAIDAFHMYLVTPCDACSIQFPKSINGGCRVVNNVLHLLRLAAVNPSLSVDTATLEVTAHFPTLVLIVLFTIVHAHACREVIHRHKVQTCSYAGHLLVSKH